MFLFFSQYWATMIFFWSANSYYCFFTPRKLYNQSLINISHNILQLLMYCTLLQVLLPICNSPWQMSHCLGISISCGLKCNPASSLLLLAMNSHNLFTGAMTLPNIDGYGSDVLTTEEESMTFTFYSFSVSRISTTYIISPKYNRCYQA